MIIFLKSVRFSEERFKKTIRQRYNSSGQSVYFDKQAYELAAIALRAWNKPLYLERAVKQFSRQSVDICILAGAVINDHGKLKRSVSVRLIEEDVVGLI